MSCTCNCSCQYTPQLYVPSCVKLFTQDNLLEYVCISRRFPKLRGIWVRFGVKLCCHGYRDDVIKMEGVLSFAVAEDLYSFSRFEENKV
ncbi:hypothetical protein CEXT_394701 [Caerostris extrusa]|uniref:Uncharacterized protein n=1 Tax=Caerostris extrusa TaxID=172846 RepID=A0AAV4UHM1_CAEEX|nr:hypothetical protein CEXT_394701 [Caerostris extrusa]